METVLHPVITILTKVNNKQNKRKVSGKNHKETSNKLLKREVIKQ